MLRCIAGTGTPSSDEDEVRRYSSSVDNEWMWTSTACQLDQTSSATTYTDKAWVQCQPRSLSQTYAMYSILLQHQQYCLLSVSQRPTQHITGHSGDNLSWLIQNTQPSQPITWLILSELQPTTTQNDLNNNHQRTTHLWTLNKLEPGLGAFDNIHPANRFNGSLYSSWAHTGCLLTKQHQTINETDCTGRHDQPLPSLCVS